MWRWCNDVGSKRKHSYRRYSSISVNTLVFFVTLSLSFVSPLWVSLVQGAYTPGPGPNQPAAEQAGAGGGSKFKLIKPDGFHSSASDKVLQER